MKFGVVVFPGSNCDNDTYHVCSEVLGVETEYLFHKERSLKECDVIFLPGGFSYGDYLRSGAIARFSPIMQSVIEFAQNGGYVAGICNGFQILCESGLLPGVLMRNKEIKFICKDVLLKTVSTSTPFTGNLKEGEILRVPIAHGDGNYYAEEDTIRELISNDQIVFQYCNENGEITEESNPNGSLLNIAGICNKERNVLGMMPHPERCSENVFQNSDGLNIFKSIYNFINKGVNKNV